MWEYLVGAGAEYLWLLLYGLLPYLIFAMVMQFLSQTLRTLLARFLSVKGWIYLTAPGVLAHELSHALFCLIFLHKIVKIQLFKPQKDGTLGFVRHSYNPRNYYHRLGNFFIGTGPIWSGFALLLLCSWWLLPTRLPSGDAPFYQVVFDSVKSLLDWSLWTNRRAWLWLYLSLALMSHITLSPADLKMAMDGLILWLIVVLVAVVGFSWCGARTTWLTNQFAWLLDMWLPVVIPLTTLLCLLILIFYGLLALCGKTS